MTRELSPGQGATPQPPQDQKYDVGSLTQPLLSTEEEKSDETNTSNSPHGPVCVSSPEVGEEESQCSVEGIIEEGEGLINDRILVERDEERGTLAASSPAADSEAALPRWFLNWLRNQDESRRSFTPRAVQAFKATAVFALMTTTFLAVDFLDGYLARNQSVPHRSPSVIRNDRIFDCAKKLSGGNSFFQDANSPRSVAVEWFLTGAGRHVMPPGTLAECEWGTSFSSLFALVVLRSLVSHAAVPSWYDNDTVAGISDVCHRWHRVECDAASKSITKLDLAVSNLSGTIPHELCGLLGLVRIEMYGNPKLSGTLPPQLGQLISLEYLNLHDTFLSGTVPSSLGDLVQLRELYLERTQLQGSVPVGICQLRPPHGNLKLVHADCGGAKPRLQCDHPSCCEHCY